MIMTNFFIKLLNNTLSLIDDIPKKSNCILIKSFGKGSDSNDSEKY